jgi:5'(3')-deoxyribonucleotidase
MSKKADFVLGVDLDGVVADYESAFRYCVAQMLGKDPSTMGRLNSWEISESDWGIEDRAHYLQLHKQAVLQLGLFRAMPMMPEASETLWKLSDMGVWIRIITHRLVFNFGHQSSVADTVTWLDANKIPYRDICFIGDKPQVGADLYIDDAPHNIENLRNSGAETIVFTQPYNTEIPGLRANSWKEVEQIVTEKFRAKKQ